MGPRLATIVVESRSLVREALKSLMANNSYRVVCDIGSTAELGPSTLSEDPKLVILGAQSAENALTEAVAPGSYGPTARSSCCTIRFPRRFPAADVGDRWLCSVVRISRHV